VSFYKNSDHKGIEKYRIYLESLKKTAIHLLKNDTHVFSKLGGLPEMPPELQWPIWNDLPLAFLCQIDLSEIPDDFPRFDLPESGLLYFFYELKNFKWGFDPNDKGSWRVLSIDSSADKCALQEQPAKLCNDYVFPEKFLTFSLIDTYPDCTDEKICSLNLSEEDDYDFQVMRDSKYQGEPYHQLLGHPTPVQSKDMDLECQLVSNGIYCGDESGYADARVSELQAGRFDWILFFQLDLDDPDLECENGGMMYFWIKKDDLTHSRFDECWMILQVLDTE